MNVWPVITRELRAQSRQRFTFALREVGVVVLLALAAYLYLARTGIPPETLGPWMFSALHLMLFFALWLLVPFGAADCLSRERREGTLGLLFLTPLQAGEVVTAKCLAHGLRAATLLLAVAPVLLVPLLMGGVNWQQALVTFSADAAALIWALAAAVLASAFATSSLRALVQAMLVSFGAMVAFVFTTDLLIVRLLRPLALRFNGSFPSSLNLAGLGGFRPVNLTPRLSLGLMLIFLCLLWLLAVLVLMLAVSISARQVRRSWRNEPLSPWLQKAQDRLCTPIICRGLFKRWMRWLLDRNPIGWLERRTWTGRIVTWSWFAVVVSVYSAVLSDFDFFRDDNTHTLMAWLLMGSVAASVAGSFRRERDAGVLELILVSPLTSGQILGGRLRGLWGQFLPAIALLLGVWSYFARVFDEPGQIEKIIYFAGTYLTLPVIGLYFSLRSRSFIGSFLATLIFALVVPRVVERAFALIALSELASNGRPDFSLGCRPNAVVIEILMAVGFGYALKRRLERRDFPLVRADL